MKKFLLPLIISSCLALVFFTGFLFEKKWTTEYKNYSCEGDFLGDILFNIGETLTPYEPATIYEHPKKFGKSIYWKSYVLPRGLTPDECAIALNNGDSSVIWNETPRFRKIKVDYLNNEKKPTWFTVLDSTGTGVVSFHYLEVKKFCDGVCPDMTDEFIRK
ncbi:MAG TPA: hypothetical protein VNB90_00780 [Cytophagaceae bacterium]|nr:hypothetical protein [Cytophagaceae bacterium]